MKTASAIVAVCSLLVAATDGFSACGILGCRRHRWASSSRSAASSDGNHAIENDESFDAPLSEQLHSLVDRRQYLASQVVASSAVLLGQQRANAADGASVSSRTVPRSKSVVVLGANGGTGRVCVSTILATGRPCIATSRSGAFNFDEDDGASTSLRLSNPKLSQGLGDVSSLDSLLSLVDGVGSDTVGAVIFAASASAKGKTPGVNDAAAVDYQGVINAAQCCIQRKIPRLVIVSSGAVTRPNSAVYKLLNLVGGGIMEAKIKGEDAVRELYRDETVMRKGLGYTVVRPGGLTAGPALGPSYLEVNQGDNKSGRLSRADVAGICAACLDVESTFDATFECYELNTAKPVENVGCGRRIPQA